jgi:hypothetical protein
MRPECFRTFARKVRECLTYKAETSESSLPSHLIAEGQLVFQKGIFRIETFPPVVVGGRKVGKSAWTMCFKSGMVLKSLGRLLSSPMFRRDRSVFDSLGITCFLRLVSNKASPKFVGDYAIHFLIRCATSQKLPLTLTDPESPLPLSASFL